MPRSRRRSSPSILVTANNHERAVGKSFDSRVPSLALIISTDPEHSPFPYHVVDKAQRMLGHFHPSLAAPAVPLHPFQAKCNGTHRHGVLSATLLVGTVSIIARRQYSNSITTFSVSVRIRFARLVLYRRTLIRDRLISTKDGPSSVGQSHSTCAKRVGRDCHWCGNVGGEIIGCSPGGPGDTFLGRYG